MQRLWNDVRFAARVLRKAPLFSLVAIATLAVGIGATTAIFSVADAVLFRPLLLPGSERLVVGNSLNAKGQRGWISYPDFQSMRRETKTLAGYSAFVPQSVNLTGRAEPRRVRGGFVSDDFFEVVGVQPAMGRGFRPGVDDKEGAANVCVVEYDTWKNVFGGDPKLLGGTLTLNNEPYTVVGILPRGFRFPEDDVDVWMPHHDWPVYRQGLKQGWANDRGTGLVGGVGRLAPGVSLRQAQAELDGIFAALSKSFPKAGQRHVELRSLQRVVTGDLRLPLLVLLGAVAFVLLIACSNVANLVLGRAASRQGELATRAALGAGRGRLVEQLLTETGLLWLGGGVLGVFIGGGALRLLLRAAPRTLPGGVVPTIDAPVLGFTLLLTAATAALFGLVPALRFSSPRFTMALKEGGRGGSEGMGHARLRSTLVVGQIALTLILLVGSGLLLRSFRELLGVDAGFRPDHLLTMEYRLPANKYPHGAQQWQTHRQILERVRAVPGVVSAALVHGLPFSGNGSTGSFEVVGRPAGDDEKPRARMNAVSAGYFETLGIPLLRGRSFTPADRADSPPVVIVNRTLADRYWPGEDPIGRRLRIDDDPEPIEVEIVGVVGDTKQYGLDEPVTPYIYASQAQDPGIFDTLAVRTQGDPMQLASAVRAAVWSVDPEQPVWKVRTEESLLDRAVGTPRFLAQLMSGYALMALLLAALGLYGVVSFSVAQRTNEIGVRMALGARARDVLRMVLRRAFTLAVLGVAIGLAGALALGRAVQSLLFATRASDPLVLLGVALLLAAVTLLASLLPARRAARTDPSTALRYE